MYELQTLKIIQHINSVQFQFYLSLDYLLVKRHMPDYFSVPILILKTFRMRKDGRPWS